MDYSEETRKLLSRVSQKTGKTVEQILEHQDVTVESISTAIQNGIEKRNHPPDMVLRIIEDLMVKFEEVNAETTEKKE